MSDYKFIYLNGKLEFIYCSVDRLGSNVRQIYDKQWNRLHFIWVSGANKELFSKYENSNNISKPVCFEKMCDISSRIAEDFPLVRVDFYESNNEVSYLPPKIETVYAPSNPTQFSQTAEIQYSNIMKVI